jgi:hypothetical protein
MITIDVHVTTSLKDSSAVQAAAGEMVTAKIRRALADLCDPVTGKGAKITVSGHREGIHLRVTGSAWVRAEAERIICAMKKEA